MGRRAAWDWLPPGGATARPDRMPVWLRILHRTPFVDRYAFAWMWFRGGWDVAPPEDLDPTVAAGLVPSTPAPRRRRKRTTDFGDWWLVTLVVGLFDPAERYLRQRPRRLRRRYRTSGTAPLPDEPSMSDIAEMQARYDAAIDAARRRWGPRIDVAVDELIRDGVTVLQLDGGQVRGRVVRFWRGDSVLDLESIGPDGERGATSRTRLSRRQEADREVLTHYLLEQAADLSATWRTT